MELALLLNFLFNSVNPTCMIGKKIDVSLFLSFFREIKDSINDTSRLVRERRKVPHTPLHAWKRRTLNNSGIFSEPLFASEFICHFPVK